MKALFTVATLSILSAAQDPMQVENDRELDNLNTQLQQERVVPMFENGKPVGHKVVRENGEEIENLDIKNGDVITAPATSEPNAEAREAGEAKQ